MNLDTNEKGTTTRLETRSSYLPYADWMRVVACLGPVLYHVTYPYFKDYDAISRTDWWLCNFIVAGTPWIVGVFMMLSGALLLDPTKIEPLKLFYRKRILRVGIPLLFWSLLFMGHEAIFTKNGLTIHRALQEVALGQTAIHMGHLYFLFAIGGLYVFTPIMRTYIAHATRKELIFGIILVFIMVVGGYQATSFARYGGVGTNAFTKFIPYLGFFLLGYYLRNVILSRKALIWAWVICIASVIITATGTYTLIFKLDTDRTDMLYRALSPTMIVTSVTIFLIFSSTFTGQAIKKPGKRNLAKILAPATLGVFLIHPVFVWHIHDLQIMDRMGSLWVSIPVISLFLLVICYLIAFMIARVPYVRSIIGL